MINNTKLNNNLTNSKYGKRTPININITDNLEFNSVDWFDDDIITPWNKADLLTEDEESNEKITLQYYNREHNLTYTIFNFGVSIEGNSICARYNDYYPYFYIRIPDEYDNMQIESFKRAFTDFAIVDVNNYVSKRDTNEMDKFNSRYYISSILVDECCEVEKEIFWKFTNHTKFRFYKLVFKSINAMKFYYRMLNKPINLNILNCNQKKFKYNLFEADFEPLLRFYHDRKLKPSGWITILSKTYNIVYNQSSSQINIECNWKDVYDIEKDEIAPLRIAAFDIEADSSHGDFPIPRKDCKKLANQLLMCWSRDNKIIEKENKKSIKYINALSRLQEKELYFGNRIKQAIQLPKFINYDNDIDKIYQKGHDSNGYIERMENKCNNNKFFQLCKELYKLCNRPIKKIKVNKVIKSIIKKITKSHDEYIENYGNIDIDTYINIINTIGKKNINKISNINDLITKMFSKDVLVKFINQLLTEFLDVINGDRTIQIGTVFWNYGDTECFHNNIITLKNCSDFKVGDSDCEIISYDYNTNLDADLAEGKLLLRWQELIKEYDPDIITGYNIHGFDMIFMYERALELLARTNKRDITQQDLWDFEKKDNFTKFLTMGRFTPDMIKQMYKSKGKLITKSLSSSALGDNILYYFNTPGRVQIDLLKVCKNSMDKLPSYKLDDVASYYISGKIKSLHFDTELDNKNIDNNSNNITINKNNSSNMVKLCIKKGNIHEIDDNNFIVVKMETTGQELYDGAKIKVLNIDRVNNILTLEKNIPQDCLISLPKWGLAKDDVSPKDIFRLQNGNDNDRMKVAKYCIQDCVLLIRLMRKLEVITNNFAMANVSLIPFSYIFLRGQGIKVFSLIVNECSENGYLLPTLEKKYKDEFDDDNLDNDNLDNDNLDNDNLDNDNLDNDNLDNNNLDNDNLDNDNLDNDNKNTNLISKKKIKLLNTKSYNYGKNNFKNDTNLDISNLESDKNDIYKLSNNFNVIQMNNNSFEGAIVLDPKPGIYFEPITVLDFSSLYPSEMIANNLSHDTMVEDKCWLGDDGKEKLFNLGYDILDITYDNYKWIDVNKKSKGKNKNGTTTIRFVQPKDGSKGLIPKILMKLLNKRSSVKKIMKKEKDAFKYVILDGQQLAFKLTGNSIYGQIGAETSKIFKLPIAACVTAGGRKNIYKAEAYCLLKNKGCDVIYGDTDSVFIKFNLNLNLEPKTKLELEGDYPKTKLDKIKRSIEIGLWLQTKLKEDKIFTSPHDLEYEKVYYPLILITKKRYIGIKYEFNPEEGKKTSMGVVTKRRDNAPILKHIFIGVVDTLMNEMDLYKSINFVQDTCKKIVDEKFDLNMFVISKTLREYYKDPESIAHKVLADRIAERDPGNKPSSNERIPYIYIKIDEKLGVDYLQGDRIEHVTYVRENKCKVDYEVYIKNQIMKPISQIFELVLEYLPGYGYKNQPKYWSHIENKYYCKYDGDLIKTYKKVSDDKRKLVHKLIFSDVILYAQKKVNNIKTIDDFFTFKKDDNKIITKINNEDIFTLKEKINIKRTKQTNITSFFTKK